MARQLPYDKPLTVEVVDGEVVVRALDGPVGISLTPEAAAGTAVRLAAAAEQAKRRQAPQTRVEDA
jgi:hypothetical protein